MVLYVFQIALVHVQDVSLVHGDALFLVQVVVMILVMVHAHLVQEHAQGLVMVVPVVEAHVPPTVPIHVVVALDALAVPVHVVVLVPEVASQDVMAAHLVQVIVILHVVKDVVHLAKCQLIVPSYNCFRSLLWILKVRRK